MPVQSIEEWVGARSQSFPLASLRNAVIGVDASHYLDFRLNLPTSIEPLLNATGGRPYSLKAALRDDLDAFRSVEATLVFVFEGLDFKNKELFTSPKTSNTLKAHKDGWKEYYSKEFGKDTPSERTAEAFSKACYPVHKVVRYFQSLLEQHSVPFIVAPYSAAAQLAYLERGIPQKHQLVDFIDTIIGTADVFLFGVERVITSFNIEHGKATFHAISKSSCQVRLDKITDEVFRDIQLLLGGPFLPTFPLLERAAPKASAKEALNLLKGAGGSVSQLCNQYRDDLLQPHDYEDLYKRAILSLQHHVVLDKDGKPVTMGQEYDARDAHEFIGLRLPEELYFYLSRGMIGPRVMQRLSSGEIDLKLPVGCEDNDAYRNLVGEQLTGLQTQTVCLLSNSLHRFYQTRSVKIKTWYSTNSKSISFKDEPSVKEKITGWRLVDSDAEGKGSNATTQTGVLRVVDVLDNPKRRRIVTGKEGLAPMKTKSEITLNVIHRFLQLRGFVNEKHELTKWGKALKKAVGSLEDRDVLEDPVYLAFEMLRLGVVDDRQFVMGSTRSQDGDASSNKTVIIKVACLGRLRHGAIGYSGPLDREMLAFQFMINEVRTSLRELLETIFVSMCLNGEVDRDRRDWSDIAFSLPLLNDNGANLAIAVATYIDDVKRHGKQNDENRPSENIKDDVKSNSDWLPKVPSLTKNLSGAFNLWDAVYAGTRELKDEPWEENIDAANKWLSYMR